MALARRKSKPEKSKPAENDSVLTEITGYVNDFYRSYNDHIEIARNYLTFMYIDMWELNIRQAREALSKPTLEFNKLVPVIRSILGEQRENSPALTVRGIGNGIPQTLIDLKEGMLRQIAYDSNADVVYQIASKQALECGWGAARVVIEYEPGSFRQYLKIVPVVDFQAAFWDLTAQLPDKSDGDYCGVYEIMSKQKFKKLNPGIDNPESVSPVGDNYYVNWQTRDTIMVCEVYYKEYYLKTLVQLSDGNEFEEKDAEEVLKMQDESIKASPYADFGADKLEEVNRREEKCYRIKHVKFIQNHVLERTDYPGQILPIPYFEGDSTVIDGERIPLPFVKDGIDEQKLINFIGSEMAYAVLRARKETVIGTTDNFAGYEDEWRNPDQVQGPLLFNNDKVSGKPEFVEPPVMNQMYLQLYQNCVQDLQQNLGWFDDARGQATNAVSGLAISQRQQASKKPANVYNDNWARGIKQIGKIILDLIPHVYDTERTVMVMGRDGKSTPMIINKRHGYKMTPDGDIEQNVSNDMSYGKFDVEIRVDGSYDAQQAEAMNVLIQLATINPQIAGLIPDLLAEASGLQNSQKLVERLKTLLPPNILAQEEGKPMPPPAPPPPPNPQQQIDMQKIGVQQQANQLKAKQMVLDEQRNMLDAHLAGLDHQDSINNAMVELHKVNTDKDVAIIDHATKMHQANQVKSVKR